MNKAIKYRIYPTKEQEILIQKTFGCARKIWNLMLDEKQRYYMETGKSLMTTPAKYKKMKEYAYLQEVDSLALANVQLQLQTAYKSFFAKKTGFPKWKSKHNSKKTYTTNNNLLTNTIKLVQKGIKLPKLKVVKAKLHRLPKDTWILKSATVSQDKSGRYFVSILFEFEDTTSKVTSPYKVIGLDYKSDGLYTDDTGNMGGNPKYFRNSQRKLAKLQRKLAKKKIGSNNRDKMRKKVAKLHIHIANQRKDFLHKKSTEIANQYDVVCVEDLNMRSLSNKGFGNGKATLDNGYGMFVTYLQYKLHDRGKYLVKVDKWYPSSQICNNCGRQQKEMKNLHKRVFTCECGYTNDRDTNAALNIKKEGLRILYS